MKINHKIKAFTLTEVMVVMVISAIVVGLAFSVLGIVQKNMRNIGENYKNQEQIQSFETALTIDFNTFPTAVWDPIENTLMVSSPIDERKYQFYNDSVVTNISKHAISIKEKMFYFEGRSVQSGSIDAIKFTFHNTKESHRLFVFKYNDATIHF
ncbi:type II secretion system protein J [Aquimarina sp. AU119]|uniref:PulJ/GspJ family protein n=1 Tax=Aquimarina sp. AU119 TaxID=2108528 RepID=UPI000D6945D9|nr:prepilin-type N-terminal cleavage/methylation domain-containing protein [Aquimarina sp. AU119]